MRRIFLPVLLCHAFAPAFAQPPEPQASRIQKFFLEAETLEVLALRPSGKFADMRGFHEQWKATRRATVEEPQLRQQILEGLVQRLAPQADAQGCQPDYPYALRAQAHGETIDLLFGGECAGAALVFDRDQPPSSWRLEADAKSILEPILEEEP